MKSDSAEFDLLLIDNQFERNSNSDWIISSHYLYSSKS